MTQVFHNNFNIGTANISILGPNWNSTVIIEGAYTVILQPGRDPRGSQFGQVDAAIAQLGLIPSSAQSLQFKSDPFYHPFAVYVEGMEIPVYLLSSNPSYALYGADVSSFAGLTRELRISALYAPLGNGFAYLDSIVFSPEAIPEPSMLGLLVLGTLLVGWRLRRIRKP